MLGRIVLPSILVLPLHIALVFLRVSAALLQGAYNEVRDGGRDPGVTRPGAGLSQSPASS